MNQKKQGIKNVTIEMENGTRIVFCPNNPSLPVQIIKRRWSGLIESPIELSVDEFLTMVGRIAKGVPPVEPNYCGA